MMVFRVENAETGTGPYNDGQPFSNAMSFEHNNGTRPAWITWATYYTEDYLGGFASLEDLRLWFAGWIDRLEECNFVVRIYDVDENNVEQFVEVSPGYEWYFEDETPMNQLIFTQGNLVKELSLSDVYAKVEL